MSRNPKAVEAAESTNRNAPNSSPLIGGPIPIIGERKLKLACRNGHYEETSRPFQMLVPDSDGRVHHGVRLCRACWIAFITFNCGMKELTDEEADKLIAEIAATYTSDGKSS